MVTNLGVDGKKSVKVHRFPAFPTVMRPTRSWRFETKSNDGRRLPSWLRKSQGFGILLQCWSNSICHFGGNSAFRSAPAMPSSRSEEARLRELAERRRRPTLVCFLWQRLARRH